jgi:threonylcarbamoyladenosine tRNA methylthiotransferase MtaB
MKTCAFFTFGCKVNQYETQAMLEACQKQGFDIVKNNKTADIYVINSCSVTQQADKETFKAIRIIRKTHPNSQIILTGCLIAKKTQVIKGVDILLPNRQKHIISEIIRHLPEKLDFKRCFDGPYPPLFLSSFSGHTRAFLKIQDGCNYNCSFCKIPQVRGKSVSRPLKDLLAEARRLADNGYKEIVLTGVCVGSYEAGKKSTVRLTIVLENLLKIKEIGRIRLSSIELSEIDKYLIETMKNNKRICPHLHIPLQSGSDRILKLMRRHYSALEYLEKISYIKSQLQNLQVTTDLIVGFPTETEQDFLSTQNVIAKLKPLKTHFFRYSSRPQTLAANIDNPIRQSIIKERLTLLRQQQSSITKSILKEITGKTLSILIEHPKKDHLEGYSDAYVRCKTAGDAKLFNTFVKVKIEHSFDSYVSGPILTPN